MKRDPAATRKRILEAATKEFSERGLAGGRVDRIATMARANKQRIYEYFESKELLFDAVFDRMAVDALDAVTMDAGNLVKYSLEMFDYFKIHPEALRIAMWHKLEREPSVGAHPAAIASADKKAAAIRQAQRDNKLGDLICAEDLLLIVVAIAAIGCSPHLAFSEPTEVKRDSISSAVSTLIMARSDQPGRGSSLSQGIPANFQ